MYRLLSRTRAAVLGSLLALAALLSGGVQSLSANATSPFLWPYNQGTNIAFDHNQAFQAWQEWKVAQITSANAGGNGRLRVMGGVGSGTTVSEGQGYGILFASIFDDQTTLDGLWLFTADHLNSKGLMDWHIGSPGQRLGTGAATDGDEDIAMGLVNACIKVRQGAWPVSPAGIDYCARATAVINAMYQWEVDKPGSQPAGGLSNNLGNELLPGDSWNLPVEFPAGIINLSYFAPGFYTVFGKFTGNAAAWEAVNARNYDIVNLVQSKPGNCSGLVPNWNQYGGDAQIVPWQPNNYSWWSYDAGRFAWRIAVDKRWYGTSRARETMNEVGGFFSSAGFDGIGEHTMNGQRVGSGPWPFFVANAASAVWAADSPRAVSCGAATGSLRETAQSAYNRVLSTKDTPNSYYGNAWRLLAMLLMTGNLPNFYEMAAGGTPTPEPPPPPQPPPPQPPPPQPPPPPPPPPSSGLQCQVGYQIVTQWNTGFHTVITITNRAGTAISGYTLAWNFLGGERISSGWNALYVQNGGAPTDVSRVAPTRVRGFARRTDRRQSGSHSLTTGTRRR
jgi:endo-1,4-beta-D-glucanase Y